MKPDSPQSDIHQTARAVVEGQLSPEEFGPLMERLRSNAEDRESYIEYIQLHSLLDKELRDKQDTPPVVADSTVLAADADRIHDMEQLTTTRESSSRFRDIVSIALAVACAVLIGIFLGQSAFRPGDETVSVAETEAMLPTVAYLSSSTGCEWGNNQQLISNSSPIFQQGQELVLLEGIAEFRLASGVSISVEGPATIVLNSPTDLRLEYGHLTFHAPWVVTDFSVQVAGMLVSACDAECGIHVVESGVSVHCFSGSASVLPDGRGDSEVIEVQSDRSISITRTPEQPDLPQLVWGNADEGQFATRLPMADELPVSSGYINEVLDDEPFGFWRFESQQNESIANEVEGGNPLKVYGELRLAEGDQNRVAEFGRPGSNCHLLTEEPLALAGLTEYSVEFWVKPSHVHHGGMVSLIQSIDPKAPARHGFHAALQGGEMTTYLSRIHPYRVRYLHRNPPSNKFREGTSVFSHNPYTVRRWLHVVAAKKNRFMRLYINNEIVASGSDSKPLADNLHLLVGRSAHNSTAATFVGQLDELAIYPRTLEAEEVASHYEAMWDQAKEKIPLKQGI